MHVHESPFICLVKAVEGGKGRNSLPDDQSVYVIFATANYLSPALFVVTNAGTRHHRGLYEDDAKVLLFISHHQQLSLSYFVIVVSFAHHRSSSSSVRSIKFKHLFITS